MARPNEQVAALLQEYADLISITGGEQFKARVYEKAARSIGGHPHDISGYDVKELQQVPNVGASIAEKVVHYVRHGHIPELEKLRDKVPAGVLELMRIPTLGPKRAMILYADLGIASIDELLDALDAGRLREHKGFGAKTEENLRHGIELMRQAGGRVPLNVALDIAQEVVAPRCGRTAARCRQHSTVSCRT